MGLYAGVASAVFVLLLLVILWLWRRARRNRTAPSSAEIEAEKKRLREEAARKEEEARKEMEAREAAAAAATAAAVERARQEAEAEAQRRAAAEAQAREEEAAAAEEATEENTPEWSEQERESYNFLLKRGFDVGHISNAPRAPNRLSNVRHYGGRGGETAPKLGEIHRLPSIQDAAKTPPLPMPAMAERTAAISTQTSFGAGGGAAAHTPSPFSKKILVPASETSFGQDGGGAAIDLSESSGARRASAASGGSAGGEFEKLPLDPPNYRKSADGGSGGTPGNVEDLAAEEIG